MRGLVEMEPPPSTALGRDGGVAHRARSSTRHALLWLLCALLPGCATPKLTEVVVQVGSDLAVGPEIDAVRIDIDASALGAEPLSRSASLLGVGATPLPLGLGLVHEGGPLGPVRVTVVAILAEREVLRRAAVFHFVRGERRLLRLSLDAACLAESCGSGQTCAGGACRDERVTPAELEVWTGALAPAADAMVLDATVPDVCSARAELCNGEDDDCDGRVDEEPTACVATGAHVASAACVSQRCVQVCVAGHHDCDGLPGNGCESDLNDDTNCGRCGAACGLPGASARCEARVCVLTACDDGRRDCDALPDNGCESDLRDTENCGGCGVTCDLPRGVEACGTGRCDLVSCDDGYDNCDGRLENGCEADTGEIFHCGICDNRCGGTAPHAAAICADGRCGLACDPGWADCDGNAANGCEALLSRPETCGGCATTCSGTAFLCSGDAAAGFACVPPPCLEPPTRCGESCVDTALDPSHCGGCGVACPDRPNAAATCAGGACGLRCDPGFGDCDGAPDNGCETPLNTTSDCGACGTTCSVEAGVSVCLGGVCSVDRCPAGTGDCDGDPANGCEVALDTLTDCGACGVPCGGAHATASCDGFVCRVLSCEVGWFDCDGMHATGCESEVATDPAHCGACGVACATAPSATATCDGGLCGLVCDAGTDDCDGLAATGCEEDLGSVTSCGACGVSCARSHARASCEAGLCAPGACHAGYDDCNGVPDDGCERQVAWDPLNCGACDNTCAPGELCSGGRCLGPTRIGQTSGGWNQTCAVRAGGTVLCWGENHYGQLGDGTTTDSLVAVEVLGVTGARSVAAGKNHGCATHATGEVSCWGDGRSGQNGALETRPVPQRVAGLSDIVEVAAGAAHSCARHASGDVLCWGSNASLQLGTGGVDRATPVAVPGRMDALALALGATHSCVVHGAGGVSCWGDNTLLQLGTEGPSRSEPMAVPGISDATAIAAGAAHTCVLHATGQVSCWGQNSNLQLGTGGAARATPMLAAVSGVVALGAGADHTCVLTDASAAYCFGEAGGGALGSASVIDSAAPVLVVGVEDSVDVTGGRSHTCSTRSTGGVYCWGRGNRGQLGDGLGDPSSSPVSVVEP